MVPAAVCSDVIAYKALISGDIAASSLRKKPAAMIVKATGLATGSYTFWQDSATAVGASQTPINADTVQGCLSACDADSSCAAVVMTGLSSSSTTASKPDSCSLVRGVGSIAIFKRSVTKAVANRLTLAAVFS